MKKYGKNVVPVTGLILFVIGAAIGYFVMRSIINAYPRALFDKYRYVYCAGTGLLLGLVLLLSSKSVLWLAFTVAGGIKKLFRGTKLIDVAGVFIGLAVGITLTVLCNYLLSMWIKVVSLRIIIDIAFALTAIGLSMFGALKALNFTLGSGRQSRKEEEKSLFGGGYLLSSGALSCEGIAEFCRKWLIGNVIVLDKTVSGLIGRGEACERALGVYKELVSCGRVQTVSQEGQSETAALIEYARAHKMRIITDRQDEIEDDEVPVLAFGALSDITCEYNSCVSMNPIDENPKKV